MNCVFKIIWNKTMRSFVVVSELAKGKTKASASLKQCTISEMPSLSFFKLSILAIGLITIMPTQAKFVGENVNPVNVGENAVGIGDSTTSAKGNWAIAIGAGLKQAKMRNPVIGLLLR